VPTLCRTLQAVVAALQQAHNPLAAGLVLQQLQPHLCDIPKAAVRKLSCDLADTCLAGPLRPGAEAAVLLAVSALAQCECIFSCLVMDLRLKL
jgi:hypothetical protein